MQSLKKNFIYNAILTMSGYIFPLMVYPPDISVSFMYLEC